MLKAVVGVLVVLFAVPAAAQSPLPAVDVTAADIQKFIDELPRDRVSDRPIRVVGVGDHRIAVYGVFRPKDVPGGANLHRVRNAEIYYMLEGAATLVTGGTLVNSTPAPNNRPSVRGSGIEGGVSRRVVPGDVIIIPGHTPHWWSNLEGDISYLIFRPDPDNRIPLR